MNAQDILDDDPLSHVSKIRQMLADVANHCRADIAKVDEPKAQVLFETAAEVLIGLQTAFEHYITEAEPAMKSDEGEGSPPRV
jgi:hypothetical protein